MANILIDARLFGPKHTGIGRYVKNLIDKIATIKHNHNISLLVLTSDLTEVQSRYKDKFSYISTNIVHYSLREQLLLPILLYKIHPDLVHFTHFNKPVLYFGKSLITIHDLIKNFYFGKDTTTRPSLAYWPKYLLYRLLTYINIKLNFLIVPSNIWRDYIIKNYHHHPQKILTTYEAVDETLKTDPKVSPAKNYIIYTGNLYPHKNIKVIIDSLSYCQNINLKILCKKNLFYQRILNYITKNKFQKRVKFLGHLDDSRFKNIYSTAIALVHPSLMEGFSLTGLEAMALNCPVVSSNQSCMPEVYGNAAIYFDPHDPKALARIIEQLQQDKKLRMKMIMLGQKHQRQYSWNKTAEQTLEYYDNILRG